jgi:hypothetical protein
MKISIHSCDGEGLILFSLVTISLVVVFFAKYIQNKNHIENHEKVEEGLNRVKSIILDSILSTHPALLTEKGLIWQRIGLVSLASFLVLGSILGYFTKQGVFCAVP